MVVVWPAATTTRRPSPISGQTRPDNVPTLGVLLLGAGSGLDSGRRQTVLHAFSDGLLVVDAVCTPPIETSEPTEGKNSVKVLPQYFAYGRVRLAGKITSSLHESNFVCYNCINSITSTADEYSFTSYNCISNITIIGRP